jgi:hypothetical protein
MKKIFKIFICLLTVIVCTSCFEIYITEPERNEFIVKGISGTKDNNRVKYILIGNDETNTITIYDLPNKYQINDTLKIVKISK